MSAVTGHVFRVERKRGAKWYAKWRDGGGIQHQKCLGPAWGERSRPPAGHFTRKLAEEWLQEKLVAERHSPQLAEGSHGRTFGEAVAGWLRYVEFEKARAVTTLRDYRSSARELEDAFGRDKPLAQITTDAIDAYRIGLIESGRLSRRTIQKYVVALHSVLKWATRKGWLATNPAERAEKVSLVRSGDFNVLTPAQVLAVAREADEPFAAAIVVAAFTGLRTGELRALRWRDVDFTGATVHVRRNIPSHGDESVPKGKQVRSTPLTDQAAQALDRLSRREHFTEPDDYVFCSEAGESMGVNALRDALYPAMAAAGIDRHSFPAKGGFTPHDLRHCFGTLAVQVWPLTDVRAYMGHADIATTMIYAHHVPKRDAAAALSKLVEAESAPPIVAIERQAA